MDFLRRRIDVAEVLVEVDGELSFGPPKTRSSRAQVSFPHLLADELGAHVAAFPDPEPQRGLVFTSDDGTPLRRSNFRRRVGARRRGRGRPGVPRGSTICGTLAPHGSSTPAPIRSRSPENSDTRASRRRSRPYGHLFPGTDDRLDTLLADTYAESLAAQPRPNGVVARISGGANSR
jgi:hypothetical protein